VRVAFDAAPRLEKYELLEELGHGGMATVYRARDRRLGREVAVKVIHRHLRDEREVKERFYREAKAVAKLRHPGIVEVYDVSEPDEAERYLVVELVRGITLRQLLREHSPLPAELGLGIGVAVADALFHAHEQGVVHRDVKPENVLLELPGAIRVQRASDAPTAVGTAAGTDLRRSVAVKITDFGIAKVLDAQGVTSTGEVLGSPAHMAPEQIEGHSVGPRADIFSLGVLIYECIVGHLPFRGNNPAQVLRRVLDGDFVPTERARPEVGALIGRLIDRALARDPEQRFGGADEFAEALRAELRRVRIAEPLQLLGEYLLEPSEFEKAFEQRLVTAIVDEAQRERRSGAIVTAAALYNRALALRPSDSAILLDVARLTRLQRRKTQVLSVAAVLSAATMCGGGLWLARTSSNRAALAAMRPAVSVAASPAVPASIEQPLPLTGESALQVAAIPVKAETPTGIGRGTAVASSGTRATARSAAPVAIGRRSVQVVLSGAAGSRLMIDGVERPWFGVKHELDFGVHRFDVIAPNEQCCVVPAPRIVKLEPGEGEIRLVLAVEFRDAVLQLNGGDGVTLTCGELFPGILAAPGRRSVRVSRPETRAACTLIPAMDSGERPRTIDVVLRPGGTFTVSGS
jgi:eukaryotic-like serine/threonine-protein kinase